jgi:hypothetical protein
MPKRLAKGDFTCEWIAGDPKKFGWYLAAYTTNDEPPLRAVTYLWFNPDSVGRWYICAIGKCARFHPAVTHHMQLPAHPEEEVEPGVVMSGTNS